MGKSGCNLLVRMAMPQFEANRALDSNQINTLRDSFENTKVSGGRDLSLNIIRSSDLKVNNDEDVINATINELKLNINIDRIGRQNGNGKVDYNDGFSSKTTFDYIVTQYIVPDSPYGKHSVLLDRSGNLLYNPDPRIQVSNLQVLKQDFYRVR